MVCMHFLSAQWTIEMIGKGLSGDRHRELKSQEHVINNTALLSLDTLPLHTASKTSSQHSSDMSL